MDYLRADSPLAAGDDANAVPAELDIGHASAGQVTAAVTEVRELLDQFRAEPASDARVILQALAVQGRVEQEMAEKDMRHLRDERERSQALAANLRGAELRAERIERSAKLALAERDRQHGQLLTILSGAQDAAAQGKAFDHEEALRRIAEVIGLDGGPERRVEPEAV